MIELGLPSSVLYLFGVSLIVTVCGGARGTLLAIALLVLASLLTVTTFENSSFEEVRSLSVVFGILIGSFLAGGYLTGFFLERLIVARREHLPSLTLFATLITFAVLLGDLLTGDTLRLLMHHEALSTTLLFSCLTKVVTLVFGVASSVALFAGAVLAGFDIALLWGFRVTHGGRSLDIGSFRMVAGLALFMVAASCIFRWITIQLAPEALLKGIL